jgi:hypothetical protein
MYRNPLQRENWRPGALLGNPIRRGERDPGYASKTSLTTGYVFHLPVVALMLVRTARSASSFPVRR